MAKLRRAPPANELIKSANGELDIEEAFHWDMVEIVKFLQLVSKEPAKYGVDLGAKGFQRKWIAELVKAVDNIGELVATGRSDNIFLPLVDVVFDGAKLPIFTVFDALGWILSITAKPPVGTTEVTEENFFIPLLALFSKWAQTFSMKTKGVEGEEVETDKEFPAMIHISYWQDLKSKEVVTLLGSTPGLGAPNVGDGLSKKQLEEKEEKEKKKGKGNAGPDPEPNLDDNLKSSRSYVVIQGRQKMLQELGFEPTGLDRTGKTPTPSDNDDPGFPEIDHGDKLVEANDGKEQDIGYGRCAETFFYIWAGTYIIINGATSVKPDVCGIALAPRGMRRLRGYAREKPKPGPANGLTGAGGYDFTEAKQAMADPCQNSCQDIMLRQMKKNWKWEPQFMVADVPRADGIKLKAGKKSGKGDDTGTPEGKDAKSAKEGTKSETKSKGQAAPKSLSKEDEESTKAANKKEVSTKNGGSPKRQPPPKPLKKGPTESAKTGKKPGKATNKFAFPGGARSFIAAAPGAKVASVGPVADEEAGEAEIANEEGGEGEVFEDEDVDGNVPGNGDAEDEAPDEEDLDEVPDEDEEAEGEAPDEDEMGEIRDEDEEADVEAPDEDEMGEIPDENEEADGEAPGEDEMGEIPDEEDGEEQVPDEADIDEIPDEEEVDDEEQPDDNEINEIPDEEEDDAKDADGDELGETPEEGDEGEDEQPDDGEAADEEIGDNEEQPGEDEVDEIPDEDEEEAEDPEAEDENPVKKSATRV